MKQILKFTVCLLLGIVTSISCKKELSCEGCKDNKPPIANAGRDTTITLPEDSTTLDGTASTDPDGTISSYKWVKIAGPASSNIIKPDSSKTIVKTLVMGVYQFELTVTDNRGLSAKDTVQITVKSVGSILCDNSGRPKVNAQLIPVGMLSEARSGMAVASAGNKILFAGATLSGSGINGRGSSRVDIYDIVTKVWSTASLSEARSDIAAVALGSKIFFAGGKLGDGTGDIFYATVDIYDASSNSWSVAKLSEPRASIAAAAVGNKVFFAGGEKNTNYDCSDRVDIYNTETNTWSTSHLGEPRSGISAVTINNKIYFAGGSIHNRWYPPTERIDIYDNSTDTWSKSSLLEPMNFLGGIAVANKIYWTSHCKVEIRDVNTWSSSVAYLFRSAGKPGSSFGGWTINEGQNIVVKDNKLVFFRAVGADPNKFDIYDITTSVWSIGVLPSNIDQASIISVNNIIYVARFNQVWKLEF